jgi:hypothetical protein
MSNRTAEIDAAYAAATPGLGAGHALEAKLIGPAAYAARLSAARDAVNDAGLDAAIAERRAEGETTNSARHYDESLDVAIAESRAEGDVS